VLCLWSGRTQHDCHHDTKVKPEAATAVIELLMMGGKTTETCWAVNKRQDNKLKIVASLWWCSWTINVEECGPCPVFASFTLAFALQLRKKHGKTSVRVEHDSFIKFFSSSWFVNLPAILVSSLSSRYEISQILHQETLFFGSVDLFCVVFSSDYVCVSFCFIINQVRLRSSFIFHGGRLNFSFVSDKVCLHFCKW